MDFTPEIQSLRSFILCQSTVIIVLGALTFLGAFALPVVDMIVTILIALCIILLGVFGIVARNKSEKKFMKIYLVSLIVLIVLHCISMADFLLRGAINGDIGVFAYIFTIVFLILILVFYIWSAVTANRLIQANEIASPPAAAVFVGQPVMGYQLLPEEAN